MLERENPIKTADFLGFCTDFQFFHSNKMDITGSFYLYISSSVINVTSPFSPAFNRPSVNPPFEKM